MARKFSYVAFVRDCNNRLLPYGIFLNGVRAASLVTADNAYLVRVSHNDDGFANYASFPLVSLHDGQICRYDDDDCLVPLIRLDNGVYVYS